MVTVITSLNPGIKRWSTDGKEIGIDYQRQCLNSWRNAGARVVSLNAEEEIHHLASLDYDAIFMRVEPRPFMPGGRPLPSISSALEVSKQCKNETIILTNSDIFFTSDAARLQLISEKVDKNEFIVANRFDVPAIGAKFGSPQAWGIDVFAFNSDKSWLLDPDVFAFGSPWWDYWLPMNALFRGMALSFLESKYFHHMQHKQAWSWASWNFGAQVFINKIQAMLDHTGVVNNIHDFGFAFFSHILPYISEDLRR